MNKKALALGMALLLFTAANLNVCCRVYVDGRCDGALYSLSSADRAAKAASAAAEEIIPGEPELPRISRRIRLSFSPPAGETGTLSGEILSSVPGVQNLWSVRTGSRYFGVVDDRDKLEERLRACLYSNMPAGALRGRYSDGVEIAPVYGRAGSAQRCCDMAQRVYGAVEAIFTDGDGHIVSG